MGNITLDNNILEAISLLAENMKTTKENIVRKAVHDYAEKVNQRNSLREIAGIPEEEADK